MDHREPEKTPDGNDEVESVVVAAKQPSPTDSGDCTLTPRLRLTEIFRRLGPVGPLAIIAASLPGIGGFILLGAMKWLAPWLRDQDGMGLAIYTVGYSLAAGFAILPTYAQSIMGGFAFGKIVGSAAALAGVFGAAMLGYLVARRASGDRVNQLIDEQPKWKAIRDALIGGRFIRTLAIVTLIRIPTNSPFAITNLVLGSTRVNPLAYAIGTIVGVAPRTIVAAVIGAGLSQWDPKAGGGKWMAIAGIVLTLIVLAIIGAVANKALHKVTRG